MVRTKSFSGRSARSKAQQGSATRFQPLGFLGRTMAKSDAELALCDPARWIATFEQRFVAKRGLMPPVHGADKTCERALAV